MPVPEVIGATPLAWRDVPTDTRREVWAAAKQGRGADDARVAAAAAEWSDLRVRRLAAVRLVAGVVSVAAVGMALLTDLQMIPPVVELRPRWGSVHGYVAWWFMTIAIVSVQVERFAARRRRRAGDLGAINAQPR